MTTSVAEQDIARWGALDADRSQVKSLVQETLQYHLPRKATVTMQRTEGEDLQKDLRDSTGERCLRRFVAGMRQYACPAGRWRLLTYRPGSEEMASDLARPLAQLNDVLREATADSNFDAVANEAFADLGGAGTATIQPQRGTRSVLEYQAYPFEQIVFEEDARGRVESVYRKFPLTARQAVEEFGEKGLPKIVTDAYHSDAASDARKTFEFVHAAVPRTQFGAGRADVKNMPVASRTSAVADKTLVRESGWPQQRYLVVRWLKGTGERHGRSPAMEALPDVKMLQSIEDTTIAGAENVTRPTILTPDNAFLRAQRIGQARLLLYRANPLNPQLKPEPWNSQAQPQFGEQYAESKRLVVAQTFFNDLFQILDQKDGATATEIRALMAEKLNLLAPNYGQLKSEWFDPMTEIDLSILAGIPGQYRAGASDVLTFATVRYVSTLALAIEYASLGALRDGWQFLSWLADVDPQVWDRYRFDEIAEEITSNLGWPARWLRPMDETRQIRAARLEYQQQQQAQQLALAQQQEAMKQGKRPEDGSPAAALMAEAA